ncbi:LON peptidase substrate-binding domain-containing protein [Xylophilus sp.]|uniref:LON peptidase substrate-binding domain-containing protein n=1 Tax=Xylophilus sp. TaxID=2653893 RepID=UPI0013B73029|nr:LON peptidase substrate-binding domain-containing protein [Xylophilus sp.]KAF1044395.1 MAG: hypothetical protein GAK38_03535 [Xylophilus sp.]
MTSFSTTPAPLTLQSLPLFPLSTVLYPGGLLPLRVFEVRYLDMARKCHAAGAPFGVVALTAGSEVRLPGAAAESFHGVGTLATIVHLESPRPGLLLMRCEGSQRFRITGRQQLPHGLWVADVERIGDDAAVPVPADLQPVADTLARVLDAVAQRHPDVPAPTGPRRFDDCGWVANRWCELLPLPLALKQQFMQLDNPLVRLELVGDVLERTGIGRA